MENSKKKIIGGIPAEVPERILGGSVFQMKSQVEIPEGIPEVILQKPLKDSRGARKKSKKEFLNEKRIFVKSLEK